MKFFHKKEVQTVILRCLVCLNLNWIKSYNIILVKIIFLSCLKMHHFMASLPKWVLTSPKETSSHIFKMVIFPKFFWAFMKHIIRWNTGEKIMLFHELFTTTIFEFSFVCFFMHKTILFWMIILPPWIVLLQAMMKVFTLILWRGCK